MSAELLGKAFASTASVLDAMPPDTLDDPTPCASWDVRALIDHIVGTTEFCATTAETGLAPTPQAHDYASGDFREAFRAGAAHAVAAFSEKGVMDRAMRLPFADLPGGVYVSIAALDTFVHGWDLAKATGQSTDLDPGVAESLLAFARAAVPATARGPDGIAAFGPPVELAEVSCPADELAAFMGRRP